MHSFCCSVAKSCLTLCDSMDCSIPGFPVLHYLLEFARLKTIKPMMQSNHLILFGPLLFLPSIFPSIRVFSNELALRIRWPKVAKVGALATISWSFSISPSNEYSGLISLRTDWFDLLAVQGILKISSTTILKHQLFNIQSSLWSNFHIHT